jgi:hypothetical protein
MTTLPPSLTNQEAPVGSPPGLQSRSGVGTGPEHTIPIVGRPGHQPLQGADSTAKERGGTDPGPRTADALPGAL